MVQRGRDQLVDILLIGCGEVSGNQRHQPSGSNRSGVYLLVGSIQLTSSTWWEFQFCRRAQRYCYVYPLRRNLHPAQRLHYCFLTVPLMSPPPLRSLISNCLNLPFGTQERSWRLHEAYFLQTRSGGHRTAFVPRSPTGSCSVSVVHSSPNIPQPFPPPCICMEGSLHSDSPFFHLNLSTFYLFYKTQLQRFLLQDVFHEPPQSTPIFLLHLPHAAFHFGYLYTLSYFSVLLRYSLYTIKSIHSKCTIQ